MEESSSRSLEKKEINPFLGPVQLGLPKLHLLPRNLRPGAPAWPFGLRSLPCFFLCVEEAVVGRGRGRSRRARSRLSFFFFSAARSTTSKIFSKTTKKGPRIVVHVIISRHSDVPSHRALPDSLRSCERGKDAEKERGLFK